MTNTSVNSKRGQMWRRIRNGKGRVFYEIGVHDDGCNFGIRKSMIYETIAVLFYNARQLEKEHTVKEENVEVSLEIMHVRKGMIDSCYSLQIKLELINVDLASLIT